MKILKFRKYALSFVSIYLTSILSLTAADADFSRERAMAHLQHIAAEPHPVGSEAHDRVRGYLEQQLTAMQVPYEVQRTFMSRSVGESVLGAWVQNVAVRLPGTEGAHTILFSAHYDSVANSPGAGDNGAAVAALLETVHLVSRETRRNHLIFLFADAEELQLLGSKAFVERHPWAKDVDLFVNFEGRGNAGSVYAFETTAANKNLVAQLNEAAPWLDGTSLAGDIYRIMPNTTDFREFAKLPGVQGIGFAHIDGPSHYHSSSDRIDALDPAVLDQHGRNAVALARYFAHHAPAAPDGTNAVFFHLPWGMFSYPAGMNLPLLILAGLLSLAALVLALAKGQAPKGGFAAALAVWPLVLLAGPLLGAVLWQIISAFQSRAGLTLTGHPYHSGVFFVGFLLVALAIGIMLLRRLVRKWNALTLTVAVLPWWLALAAACMVMAPGSMYLFVVPLLFFAPALLVCILRGKGLDGPASIILLAGALPMLLLQLPVDYAIYLALPVLYSGVVALLVSLGLSLLLPILAAHLPDRFRVPPVALLLGLTCLGVGFSLNLSVSAQQPKFASLSYGLDLDSGEAYWFSSDPRPNGWTRTYLAEGERRPSQFIPGIGYPFLHAKADNMALTPPTVEVLEDRIEGTRRHLRLVVTSQRDARNMMLEFDGASRITGLELGEERWGRISAPLRLYGVPEAGLEFALTLPATKKASFRVIELKRGLPEGIARPEGTAPSLFFAFFQDATFSSRSFVL